MKCKVCHPIYENRLVQTGRPAPKSYMCAIYGVKHLHDDKGRPLPLRDDGECCPTCYSQDLKEMLKYSFKCNFCGTVFSVDIK